MTVGFQRAPHAGWRALAATVLIITGACAAHAGAGGHLPTWPYLAALAGIVFAAGFVALRGAVSTRVLVPLLLVAQVGLHESFSALAASGPGEHPGHMAQMASHSGAPWSWRMFAAHAAVTVLAAVVWRLCTQAAVAVVAFLESQSGYGGVRRDPRRTVFSAASAGADRCLVAAPRRGPPQVLCRA